MVLLFATLLTLLSIIQYSKPSRILAVIPTASYSHQMFYQPIWRELALRGHQVVVLTTDPTNETLPNLKEISLRETYPLFRPLMARYLEAGNFGAYFDGQMSKLNHQLTHFQMRLPQVQKLYQNTTEHFDLLMVEHITGPFLGLKKLFKCPMIGLMSYDASPSTHGVMGNPVHSILYPNAILAYHNDMTFLERLMVIGFNLMSSRLDNLSKKYVMSRLAEQYFKIKVDILETFEEVDMLFINANPVFTLTRPLTPSTINLAGGIHIKEPMELPEKIKVFLDTAPRKVIYFSLGTNVLSNELPPKLLHIILTALSQVPYKILWKFENDTLPGKPDNVMITKWAPQQDVLRHPKVKLFITQGGLQSLEESLFLHVPMVVVPFLGEQVGNAQKVQTNGLGLSIMPSKLTVTNFKAAILEVIENSVYQQRVTVLGNRIQDEPMSPLERAVWWTEYVLRHKGGQHLKGPRIPYWQYYYLDVLSFIGVVLVLSTGVIKMILKALQRLNLDVKNIIANDKAKKAT